MRCGRRSGLPKKILFVVNVDWFFISHRLPLATEALQRGYEVHIACGITDKREFLENLGVRVHSLRLLRSATGMKGEIEAFVDIYRLLQEVAPDVAHFVTIKPVLYGGIASRFLSLDKRVFSISGLGFLFIQQGLKASLVRGVIKRLYSVALGGKNSCIIVQNPNDKRVVSSIRKVPITLIRGSGVDLHQYKYKEEQCEKIKVVMACRLLRDKGVFEYLEAARILKRENTEFALYGDIDEHNPATLTLDEVEQIRREGVVQLHGFSSDMARVFRDANIVVLPSYREGLPKVLIEAAACGRAVVTTDVAGCRDAIEPNVTGLLCKVKDARSLAEQIEKLVANEELRQSMGRAGRVLAEKEFDIKRVVAKHFEIYER